MATRSLRRQAADTVLAQWLVGLGESRGWTSGRQAAKYLKVNQATFGTWLRGEFSPGADMQQHLADQTGEPLEKIARLAAASKPSRNGAATVGPSGIPSLVDAAPLPATNVTELLATLAESVARTLAAKPSPESPVYAWGTAGDPRGDDSPEPVAYRAIPPEMAARLGARAFAVRVRGDSMSGQGIADGDLVWVDPAKRYRSGHPVLARIEALDGRDDGMVVKLFRRTEAGEVLLSDGADGETVVGVNAFTIIGPVMGAERVTLFG